ADVEHYVVGSVEVENAVGAPLITSSGSIVINGTPVAFAATDTLQGVVNKINAAAITGIRAVLFQLSGKSRLLVRNTMSAGQVIIENTSTPSVLMDIGFSGSQVSYYAPKAVVGLDGDIAV